MFPGAEAPAESADYAIIGAPLDVSATFRPGARFGPERVRAVATAFEDYDRPTDARFSELSVYDHGDLRGWSDPEDYLSFLEGELRDLRAAARPILVGGEHTVSVAGVRATEPDVFVSLDAHLDLREAFDGDPYSHATVTHHALAVADRAIVIGGRAGAQHEWERATDGDVDVVNPEAVGAWSPSKAGLTDPETLVYCSVDMDVADPSVAPATGTPEPGGLLAREVRTLVRDLAPHAIGFDVTEITDRDDDQTALLAAKLVRDYVFAHAGAR